jgi:hypothetical protein
MHDGEVPAATIPKTGNCNSCGKDDENTTVIGSSPDEDDDKLPSSYVPKHFKDDVGIALNHKARLSDVKVGLASHSIYPIERTEVASAPRSPTTNQKRPSSDSLGRYDYYRTSTKKMNVVGNTKYEY